MTFLKDDGVVREMKSIKGASEEMKPICSFHKNKFIQFKKQ